MLLVLIIKTNIRVSAVKSMTMLFIPATSKLNIVGTHNFIM